MDNRGRSCGEQLLHELRAGFIRLKAGSSPIFDGQEHLVPFFETVEAIFRHGLKQPGSFFGVTHRDYWNWIEVLPTANLRHAKQNPLLGDIVNIVKKSTELRTSQGRGRCFIRLALERRLIPVPAEHLLKNPRLLQFWYAKDSVLSDPQLAGQFVNILFETTELEFSLTLSKKSFLDESWLIPVYLDLNLPPCKRLGVRLAHVQQRVLVYSVTKGSIAETCQIEKGDIIEELNGNSMFGLKVGRAQQLLAKHEGPVHLTLVKNIMPDGTPFAPARRRQIYLDLRAPRRGDFKNDLPDVPIAADISRLVQKFGDDRTNYSVVLLGKAKISNPVKDGAIDTAIHEVLEGTDKPQEVCLTISRSDITVRISSSQKRYCSFVLSDVSACTYGYIHQTCFGFAAGDFSSDYLDCFVFETPSEEMARAVIKSMVQVFRSSTWYMSPSPLTSPRLSPRLEHQEETSKDSLSTETGSLSEGLGQLTASVESLSSRNSGGSEHSPLVPRSPASRRISRRSSRVEDPVLRESWKESFYGELSTEQFSTSEDEDLKDDTEKEEPDKPAQRCGDASGTEVKREKSLQTSNNMKDQAEGGVTAILVPTTKCSSPSASETQTEFAPSEDCCSVGEGGGMSPVPASDTRPIDASFISAGSSDELTSEPEFLDMPEEITGPGVLDENFVIIGDGNTSEEYLIINTPSS